MAQSDFLYAPEEIFRGNRDESLSRGPDSFLPYRRTEFNPKPGKCGPGVDSVVGLDPILPPRSAVNRSKPDTSCCPGVPDTAPASRRRLLWEVWDGYHCSICGTCLSFAELRKIATKAGLQFEPDESEHGIHGHFRAAFVEAGARGEADSETPGPEVSKRGRTFPPGEVRGAGRRSLEAGPDGGRRAGPVLGPHDASAYHHPP